MRSEFDPAQSKAFVRVALQRGLLTDVKAQRLLQESLDRSVMPVHLAIESGVLESVDVEIVDAFTDPTDLAPGYELLDVVGSGALGVVYRARQPRLQRDVAIKAIMQNRVAQQNVIARFHQEGAAIGRLQHPNIVSAYDSGTHNDRVFLVMELVNGEDLRQRLKRGPLDLQVALWILRQTASGLAHALSHRIIHRDIKPGNLILTDAPAGFDLPGGVPLVKIADFGLARLNPPSDEQEDTRLTMTGAALGTPMYSSPEQLTGDPVDHRADIYALGATLFHMLAGETPFRSEKVSQMIVSKVTGENPRLELLPDDLEPGVRQLLLDMMAHDPDARVGDYQTLIQRIDQIQGKLPPSSTTINQRAEVARSTAGRGFLGKPAFLATVFLIAAIAGSLGIRQALLRPPGESPPAVADEPMFPTMVPTGWEKNLFDGSTSKGWTAPRGLFDPGEDAEGARVLIVDGSGVCYLPKPSAAEVPNWDGIGVEVAIDLLAADSAELHFGFAGESTDGSRRFVVKLARDGVALGTRDGISGDFEQLGESASPPDFSKPAPNYHALRIELQRDHWFVFQGGNLVASTRAVPTVHDLAIQLVAGQGLVHFGSPTMFTLTASTKTSE